MIKHPKYIGSGYSFDIGLLKLNKNIKFNDFVKAIKLPPQGHLLYENCTAIATGWGKLSDSNPKSKKLQFVPLKVTNIKECDTFYRKTFGLEILCTSTKGKKSTCSGDSGGPLVYYNQVLIGISAFVPTFIFN
uniref:Peptidase S1 domain-containing protein n=1 Tax=Megaselia scalaris TaxID=36166 RepID=T1GFN1_MEGSC